MVPVRYHSRGGLELGASHHAASEKRNAGLKPLNQKHPKPLNSKPQTPKP